LQKREIRYSIYEELLHDERISLTSMAKKLGLARNTVNSHYNYMIRNEILFPPSMRLKMFEDLREYVYFLTFERPMRVYQELENDPRVVYHCLASGAFDMVAITETPVNFESHPYFEGCLLHGPRSDIYFPSHISLDTYEEAFQKIKKTLKAEDPEPGGLHTEFPKREVVWTDLEWKLFYDLKYNMRRTFTEIVKKHGISKWIFYKSYKRIKKNCIRIISFYPKKRQNYSDFYFLFKTDYEKALTDLFLQLPCSSMIWHVDDRMAVWLNILRTFSFREIFGLLHWMDDHGIIEDMVYALPVYSHKKYLPDNRTAPWRIPP